MLENLYWKIRNHQNICIAYFGGSITEGAGASLYEKSFAGRTTAWFRETFPDCQFSPIQAAIGGTGSGLGAYRCDSQVGIYQPDLVFYEFACNDSDRPFSECFFDCDAIFRKLHKSNPYVDIIMLYTSTKAMSDTLIRGDVLTARTAQSAVAYLWGDIMQIDIGEALRFQIIHSAHTCGEGEEPWMRLTNDTVHPTDKGYQIYFECIRTHLEQAFACAEQLDHPIPKHIPAPYINADFPHPADEPDPVSHENARMEDARTASFDNGWHIVEQSLCGRYPSYLESDLPGAELSFSFEGTRIELFWMMASDSGDVLVSVDGEPFTSRRSWDHYCKSFNRAGNCTAAAYLAPGRHTLRLRVSSEKAEESKGTVIRIGAFLIE